MVTHLGQSELLQKTFIEMTSYTFTKYNSWNNDMRL